MALIGQARQAGHEAREQVGATGRGRVAAGEAGEGFRGGEEGGEGGGETDGRRLQGLAFGRAAHEGQDRPGDGPHLVRALAELEEAGAQMRRPGEPPAERRDIGVEPGEGDRLAGEEIGVDRRQERLHAGEQRQVAFRIGLAIRGMSVRA